MSGYAQDTGTDDAPFNRGDCHCSHCASQGAVAQDESCYWHKSSRWA